MKCSQCGCEKLLKTKFAGTKNHYTQDSHALIFLVLSSMDRDELISQEKVSTYVCSKCGHVELFCPEIIEDLKKENKDK